MMLEPTTRDTAPAAPADEDLFDTVAADFLAGFRAGERPAIDEYAVRYPDIAAEIRELFPTILAVERMKLEKEHSSDGRASLGARRIERLGDFRIVREIGRGGMGIVYEAIQESLGRRVALKVLPPNALLDETHVRRFHREARTAAALHHTNIVPVFGVGEADGLHYYVMQLIDGEPLDRAVDGERRPMDPRQAADVIRRIAQAVQYAHDHKTLHRDIKPANLLLDRNGDVWITDFGLAQALEREDTVTDHVAGTLRYMAPERFRGVADERTDQYALGITLYELVTGARAFAGASSGELLQLIEQQEPLAARRLAPAVPRDLQTIIERAIAKSPAHRYRSVGDFAADLKNFLDGRPIQARPISPPERLWRWCLRNRALAASLAVAAVLLVVVAAMLTIGYYRAQLHNQTLREALTKEQAALRNESTALDNERLAREREQRAREAAEAITSLALEGLDRVFDEFAPASPYTVALASSGAAADEAEEPLLLPAQATVSPQVATALGRLLPLYRRLADETAGDVNVRLRAASAQHRLGLIYRQLGNQEAAIAAFWAARTWLEALRQEEALPVQSLRLDLARVLNDLGDAERFTAPRPGGRRETHQQALELLSAVPPRSLEREERLELARTHFFLGQRDVIHPGTPRGGGPPRNDRPRDAGDVRPRDGSDNRPRRDRGDDSVTERRTPPIGPVGSPPPRDPLAASGPPPDRPPLSRDDPGRGGDRAGRGPGPWGGFNRDENRRHLATAIRLLEQFPHNDRDTRVHLLLARCYREQAAVRSRDDVDIRKADWDKSVELLRELVQESPKTPDFRFELADTYADLEPRWWPDDRLPEAEERLRDALRYSEPLVADHPDIPAYAAGLTQIRQKLAHVLNRTGRIAESELLLRGAIDLQSSLAARFPESPTHVIWKARLSRSLADVLVHDERSDEAVVLLQAAATSVEPLVQSQGSRDQPATQFAWFTLNETYLELARLLDDRQRPEEAQEYRLKMQELSSLRFPRRPPLENP